MNSKEYLEEMKKIQENLLDYLDYESNAEEKYQNLKIIFDSNKIHEDQYRIKSIMYLIIKISKNHHREEGFFGKIEKILQLFTDDLQKYFSNSELFHIFKGSKRILLFLIEEKIMKFDEFIVKRITKGKFTELKYPEFFQPEIKPFLKEKWFPKYDESDYLLSRNYWIEDIAKEIPDHFYEKRKIGENDDFICTLIRKDSIDEFITFVKKKDISLDSEIDPSIYETNNFLIRNKYINAKLIEYAAFFGSIQIFKYLYKNGSRLTPLLWFYAIHGKDAEIIEILKENNLKLYRSQRLFKESVKCHHIDVANYILNNNLDNENEEEILNNKTMYGLKYYSFIFISNDKITETSFNDLCKYDYYILVFVLLNTKDIDINNTKIFIVIIFIRF